MENKQRNEPKIRWPLANKNNEKAMPTIKTIKGKSLIQKYISMY